MTVQNSATADLSSLRAAAESLEQFKALSEYAAVFAAEL